MKMQEIRAIAKKLNIKIARPSKLKLIQAIQLEEGNFSCFASASSGACDQLSCIWREDCFSTAAKNSKTMKK